MSDVCLHASVCVLVAEPTERKPGRRESSSVGPDSDTDAAESHVVGADHGKQGPVPRRAKTIHVKASKRRSEMATFLSVLLQNEM